jgi:hypothetical protein
MSASDHIGMQFKITQPQQTALETWLIDYEPEETGFTHNVDSKTPSISVHNLGHAALKVGHAANLVEISNEEYKQRGAANTAKGLWKVADNIRKQYETSQAAGVMVGGKYTPIERS